MTDQELIDRLAAVPLFAGLPEKQLAAIAEAGKVVPHAVGGAVAEQDQSGAGFHLILEGTVSVQVGGVERASLGPGDYFGEMALIDGQPRSATVTPTSTLTTFSLTSWQFRPLLDDAEIVRRLLEVLCARLRAAETSALA